MKEINTLEKKGTSGVAEVTILVLLIILKSWKRSSRGHDQWLTHQLDPGNQGLFPPSLGLGMYILPSVPTVGDVFRDAAFREQCGVETIWTAYVTEPS